MASDHETTEKKKSSSDPWKERIYIPTLIAGIIGGGAGLISKRRKTYGVANISAMYATNLAICTGCYCAAREFVRNTRASTPDDLMNSVLGGIASGALLGRLQGGQFGAVRYSIIFALTGTALDFAALRLKPLLQSSEDPESTENSHGSKKTSNWTLPEWSPIQILDEEALAAKRAREQQLFAQRTLNKEES
ncbi:mitochondrial import inner membrane translocase subunit Tim17/Tim22/Tim23 family protein [Tasmannia lanceolata]|uniref:mitochondrial import inner membrane translocase subunit Tim17/Tim22/Tim23 family protein n=1 Tax=Tasmannia lanceolata TaxID=3420 RepID=UPI004063F068